MRKAIGIFDSGVGGLTVLKEILARLPDEHTIYLGDTARVPYGSRSTGTVTRYSFENTRFLLSQDIKVLVVACNTASAVSLEAVTRAFPLPIIGVLEPGARAAVAATHSRVVGIIGTEATVGSGAYERAIHRLDPGITVRSRACPLFVPLVEEGWIANDVAELVARKYLADLKDSGIDTLVLGCTHYPLLKSVIRKVVGPDIVLIDSATETAAEVVRVLDQAGLRRDDTGGVLRRYHVTDAPARFERIAKLFMDDTGLRADQVSVSGQEQDADMLAAKD